MNNELQTAPRVGSAQSLRDAARVRLAGSVDLTEGTMSEVKTYPRGDTAGRNLVLAQRAALDAQQAKASAQALYDATGEHFARQTMTAADHTLAIAEGNLAKYRRAAQ